MYSAFLGTLHGLDDSRRAYYERQRFADLFASAKRVPERVADRLAALPGVATLQTRVRTMAVLDLPGVAEPASGIILSLPDQGFHKPRAQNNLYVHYCPRDSMRPGAKPALKVMKGGFVKLVTTSQIP